MDDVTQDITHDSSEDGKVAHRARLVTGIACTVCALVFVGLLQEREPDSWLTLSGYGYLPAGAIWSGKYDYAAAIGWYRRAIDLYRDSVWTVENLARAYRSFGNQPMYDEALNRLRLLDPSAAHRLEQDTTATSQDK